MGLNRGDLIRMTAYKAHVPVSRAEEILEAFIECMNVALAAGEDVSLRGLGRFTVRKRKPHLRQNPSTKEFMNIPERTWVSFKMGQFTRERVNRGK